MDRTTLLLTLTLLLVACAPKRVAEASSTLEDLPNEPTADAAPVAEAVTEEPAATPAPPAPALVKVELTEGFTVLMPKDSKVQRKALALKKGGTIQTVTAEGLLDGVLYSVTRAEFPEAVAKKRGVTKMLSEVRDGLAAQLKGAVSEEKDVELLGHPGQSFAVAGANNLALVRSAVVENQVYSLIVVYSGKVPDQAATFLGSIELMAPPAAALAPQPPTPSK